MFLSTHEHISIHWSSALFSHPLTARLLKLISPDKAAWLRVWLEAIPSPKITTIIFHQQGKNKASPDLFCWRLGAGREEGYTAPVTKHTREMAISLALEDKMELITREEDFSPHTPPAACGGVSGLTVQSFQVLPVVSHGSSGRQYESWIWPYVLQARPKWGGGGLQIASHNYQPITKETESCGGKFPDPLPHL